MDRFACLATGPHVHDRCAFVLEQFAAPCIDLLDGPCDHNWASDAQWMILPLLLLAMIVSLCLAVWDLGSLVLRRWRRSPR